MTLPSTNSHEKSGKLSIIGGSGDEGQDEMSHSSMECVPLWLEKRAYPLSARRWIYRLENDITYGSGETSFVCVSWGRAGDTNIFPCDSDGRVLDWSGFVEIEQWDFWKDPDEAMTEFLTGKVELNPWAEEVAV